MGPGDKATGPAEPSDLRARVIAAASGLIAQGGPEAATTRAVAAAAGVQAPAIYRLFGDKRGLLAAVVEEELRGYVALTSARVPHPDPLQDLRDGWDMHVAFGLSHPGLFAIMSGDPQPSWQATASSGGDILRRRIQKLARAGRLRATEDRAIDLMRSMATGVVLTMLQQPEADRDPGLAEAAREAVLAAISGEAAVAANAGLRGAAAALNASLDQTEVLTPGERHLLTELLKRIVDAG